MSLYATLFNQKGKRLGGATPYGSKIDGSAQGALPSILATSGALPSSQAAQDVIVELNLRFPRLTFKATQNADGTFAISINADNGGAAGNCTYYGSKVDGTAPAAMPAGIIVPDAVQYDGGQIVRGAITGQPILETIMDEFFDAVAGTG